MTKLESLRQDFSSALDRLAEVLRAEKTDIVRDSAIKRFEILFDLGWKTAKAFLEEYHNIQCVSPRNCFREAFRAGFIDYDEYWLEMTKLRNYSVHTYCEALAEKVYSELPRALDTFRKLADALNKSPA